MKKIAGLIGLVVITLIIGSQQAASASGPDSFWIDQGGAATEITALTSSYDLSIRAQWQAAVLPLAEPHISYVFLHDNPSGELSLGIVHNSVLIVDPCLLAGRATMDITGLPDGSTRAISDDEYAVGEFDVDEVENTAHGQWAWLTCYTDGGAVFLGDGDFNISIDAVFGDTPDLTDPITDWVFISGSGSTIPLEQLEALNITNSPTKAQILSASGVGGKGISKAPGLDKEFNSKSKAADNAGKKK